jgi:hypothetical protein
MLVNNIHLTELNSPKQTIKARVELLRGSTLERVCTCSDVLSEMSIERTGEGKFFGFGICQKLNVSLIDIDRDIEVTKDHSLEAVFGVGTDFIYPFPRFFVQDIQRDEVSNMLNLTAYDILFQAEKYKVSDLGLLPPYTIRAVTAACANILGVPLVYVNVDPVTFDVNFPEGANFDGTESVRYALNAIAEATQTIYYMNNRWELTFRRLNKNAANVETIGRDEYIELFNQDGRTITNIAHVTELGDNTSTIGDDTGVTQFIRENPFWELRNDIDDLLNQAQVNIAGLSIQQFESTWSGNYLIEIGDRIGFVTENGDIISTFLLDDTITFDGTLMEYSQWHYDDNEGETFTNPVTVGDTIRQTYARVDKANQRIDLMASDVEESVEKVAQLSLTTEEIKAEVKRVEEEGDAAIGELSIATDEIKAEVSRVENENDQATANLAIQADNIIASVQTVETQLNASVDDINNNISTLTKSIKAKVTSDQVNLAISQTLDEGLDQVAIKSTDFVFDSSGLTISKTKEPTSTNINPNGLVIYEGAIQKEVVDDEEIITNNKLLEVNKDGVNAINLHATTYLKVGGRSRFENYESDRTGCFWIGGTD